MMAQVTSGRLSSSRRSWVTKSAPIFSATCKPRLWFFSAMPIHSRLDGALRLRRETVRPGRRR
jgi:hypothetical protein